MSSNKPRQSSADARRKLPAVSRVLDHPELADALVRFSHEAVVENIQAVLDEARKTLKSGAVTPDLDTIAAAVRDRLRLADRDRLRRVINATGVILHTGLGRAVLPQAAADALAGSSSYCNLQIDLATGRRGKRNHVSEQLLCRLTGAEAAMIVNNNAAATLLILASLCSGMEVIVSRGQLIEIGGSFRLPDCVHQSGAILKEVGTTNKTHLRDYEAAVSEDTAAILRVNPSNYRVVGFAEQVPVAELVALGAKHSVPVIDDLGCGALLDLSQYGLPHEPTASDSIAAGADLVCFSGDKLISGPQAGIIVGRKELVDRIRKHPLTRMLRVGKLTDLALEHTLRLFLDPDKLAAGHPTMRMLTAPMELLAEKAKSLAARLTAAAPDISVQVVEGEGAVGGGSLPDFPMRSVRVAVSAGKLGADNICGLLRDNEPPVIARIQDDEVLLDMRTLLPGDDDEIIQALIRTIG